MHLTENNSLLLLNLENNNLNDFGPVQASPICQIVSYQEFL